MKSSSGSSAGSAVDDAAARILIKNATILTMSGGEDDLVRGDILIGRGKIEKIGLALECETAVRIDALGMIAIPGFQDTHRHSWEGQLRRLIPSGDLGDYTCATHGGYAQHYQPEDIYAGTILTAYSAINSGITTILDYSHNSQSIEHCHAAIDALVASGIRAVYAAGAPSVKGSARTSCIWPDVVADLARARFGSSGCGLVDLRMAGTPQTLHAGFFDLARQLGIGVSIDAVAGDESSGWIAQAGRRGWLGRDRTLIHCTGLTEAAWSIIAETQTTVSLCPHADTQYAIGEPPLFHALKAGVRPSISVDDDMGLASDMWTQMRILSASYRQNFGLFERNPRGSANEARTLKAYDLLEFATVQGARANGMEERCGTICAGMDADIVLIDGRDMNNMPLNNAYGSVVHGSDSHSVRTVIIGGVIRKHEGRLVGVDQSALYREVIRSRDNLVERLGVKIDPLDRTV